MIRLTKCIPVLLLMLFTCFTGSAQRQKKVPAWIPDHGNWMVVSNVNTPLHSVIYFYTSDGVIIYKETVDGLKIDLTKKSVKMRLKKVLTDALTAWKQNKKLLEEQEWVSCLFKRLN